VSRRVFQSVLESTVFASITIYTFGERDLKTAHVLLLFFNIKCLLKWLTREPSYMEISLLGEWPNIKDLL
jgi:hypothetical protein